MKTSTLKIFLLIFSFAILNSFAQEKPKAVLIDNFGPLECEDIWARGDGFSAAIQSSPNSTGYAVIYGRKNATKQNLAREKLIAGIMETRGLNKDQFEVIRGRESEEPHTDFWLVPAGADQPNFEEVKWDLTFSKNQKPFIFHSLQWDILCPSGNHLKIYSDYLTENPKARGNIVISAKSKSEFQKRKINYLDELSKNYNISPKRIRFFFVKENSDYESYELWLLP